MTYTEEWERRKALHILHSHPSLSCDIHTVTRQRVRESERERERVWWAEEDSGGR